MKKDKGEEQFEKKKREMKQVLASYPDLDDVVGFTSSDNQIFKILYALIEHSQTLNRLTKWIIGLTVVLAFMTIMSLLS